MIPAEGDPHTYEATPRDILAVGEANAFVSMGKSLEPFMEAGAWRRAVREAGIPELTIDDEMELIAVDKVIDHGDHVHDLREGDPHVWLDPLKTVEMVAVIAAFLAEIDPEGAEGYAATAAGYEETPRALHGEMEEGLARIPEERRKLVVFHDAYTYFAARYGFEIVGMVLKNPGAEASAKEVAALKETIEEAGVTVVFGEPRFNTDVLEVVVAETGVEIGVLLTDSFAGEVDGYVEMMRFNLESLTSHLVSET